MTGERPLLDYPNIGEMLQAARRRRYVSTTDKGFLPDLVEGVQVKAISRCVQVGFTQLSDSKELNAHIFVPDEHQSRAFLMGMVPVDERGLDFENAQARLIITSYDAAVDRTGALVRLGLLDFYHDDEKWAEMFLPTAPLKTADLVGGLAEDLITFSMWSHWNEGLEEHWRGWKDFGLAESTPEAVRKIVVENHCQEIGNVSFNDPQPKVIRRRKLVRRPAYH